MGWGYILYASYVMTFAWYRPIPIPDDWRSQQNKLLPSESCQLDLVHTSTRILLLTIQLLLLIQVHKQEVVVECLMDEDGFVKETTAELALHLLHVCPCPLNLKQPMLFSSIVS